MNKITWKVKKKIVSRLKHLLHETTYVLTCV